MGKHDQTRQNEQNLRPSFRFIDQSNPDKRRKKRFTKQQLKFLREEFHKNRKPEPEKYKELAALLGHTAQKVRVYFANRRARLKPEKESEEEAASGEEQTTAEQAPAASPRSEPQQSELQQQQQLPPPPVSGPIFPPPSFPPIAVQDMPLYSPLSKEVSLIKLQTESVQLQRNYWAFMQQAARQQAAYAVTLGGQQMSSDSLDQPSDYQASQGGVFRHYHQQIVERQARMRAAPGSIAPHAAQFRVASSQPETRDLSNEEGPRFPAPR